MVVLKARRKEVERVWPGNCVVEEKKVNTRDEACEADIKSTQESFMDELVGIISKMRRGLKGKALPQASDSFSRTNVLASPT